MTKSNGVALLVGAGDAIGAAVARRFAQGGYKVCIARREAAKSQALVDELSAAGHEVRAYSVDARKEEEIQKLFTDVERGRSDRSVSLQRRIEREQAIARDN
jgi:NAD(P)-dependent dehydrogenase (short-subunit alcohol dehydrogenase family)